MPYFAVIVERGAAWNWSLPMRQQEEWDAHAAFMDALAADGFIVAGGPLGSEDAARRILHIARAADASTVRNRLAGDPWHRAGFLRIVSIDPWTVLLGSLSPPVA
jgi:uncharacterized protein YciI